MKKYFLPLMLGIVVLLSGCATIIHGSKQTVGIASNPTKATVTVDGQEFGQTPVNASLSRKDNHIVVINLEGYSPYETTLTRKVDGWIAGNIVIGGLIGLAVDAITGGMYKLTPDQIQAELSGKTALVNPKDNLYLFVTLTPNPEWEKIDTLQKIN